MPTDIKVLQIYTDFRTFAADFEYSNQDEATICLCVCAFAHVLFGDGKCMGIVFPFP